MKNRTNLNNIIINGLVAALYAAATIAIYPLSYGAIQMRFSEVMVFLAFYNKKFIPGLVLGCFIANIPSSLGVMDMVFGTFSTLVVTVVMYKLNNRYLAALAGGVITGLVIGAELYVALDLPFAINALYVFIGEALVLVAGAIIFGLIEKNDAIMKIIRAK